MAKQKSEFVVLAVITAEGEGEGEAYAVAKHGLANTQDAHKWLKKRGKPGEVYQIASFRGKPLAVEETPIIRRKLNLLTGEATPVPEKVEGAKQVKPEETKGA